MAVQDAGTLEIKMLMGLARLQQDVTQAVGIVGRGMAGIQSAVAQTKTVFAGLGITLGVGAFTALVKGSIDAMDHLNDLSKTTGLAVEQLSGLRIAAKQSGTDLEGVATSINKLSVSIGQNSEKFRALGVTAKDPLEAFKQLADVFSTIQDPQLRAALGAEALGKSWQTAAPLLAEGGAKIGEMVEKGARFSGVTKEMAEQADALNDKLVLLTGTQGTWNRLIGPVLPLLNQLADQLLKSREEAAKLGESNFKPLLEAGKAITVFFGNVAFVLKGIGTEIGGIAAQMAAVAVGDFKRAADIGRMMKTDAAAARLAFDQWETSILAVGTASASTSKQIDTMDQVTRRMISTAEAQARAFLEAAKRKKEEEDAAKKAMEEAERLRKLDLAGWVAHAESVFAEADKLNHDLAAISETYWANEERLRHLDEAGWIAYIEQQASEYEAGLKAIADKQPSALQEMQAQWKRYTDAVSTGIFDFFADLFEHGKSAFGNLWDVIKRFFAQLAAMFATRFVLQVGASLLGGSAAGSALASAAGSVGSGTLLGEAGNFLFGSAGAVTSTGLAEPAAAGLFSSGGVGAMLSDVGAFMMSNPVTMALAAIVILAGIFSRKGGGPKDEGQASAQFGPNGELIGPGASMFNIVGTSANGAAQQFAEGVGKSFFQMLASFGGTAGGLSFGTGIVRDPKGTAPTFVDTQVRDANGNIIFNQHNANVGRSDEDLQGEVTLQSQRAIVAALQSSDLPPMIAGIFDTINAQTASLDEINAAFAEAARLQQTWASFQQLFMTDVDRLAAAKTQVTDGFKALGIEAPKSVEDFKALVKKAWDDGDKTLFDALVKIAPAFKLVEDASNSAAQAMKEHWMTVQDSIDTILGRDRRPGQLGSMMGQLGASDGMFAGLDLKGLAALVAGFSEDQWNALTDSQRTLIESILTLGATMTDSSNTIAAAVEKIVFPEVEAQTLQQQFQSQYGGLIGAAPNLMGRLSLGSQLMSGQVATWQQQQSGLSEYDPKWQTLQKAIDDFKEKIRLTGADIAHLTILTAQYGESKAEELFNLEKWYDAQKSLVEGNALAMDALKDIFDDKWKAIIDGIANDDSAKNRLAEWWRGLFLNQQLSPLTLQQKFDQAKKDYEAALAGGDLSKIQGSAQSYLEFARQLFASSGAYTAIFRDVAQATGTLAGISQTDINSRLYSALPTSSTMASTADILRLEVRVAELTTLLAERGIKVQAPELEKGVERLGTNMQPREGALA